MSKWYKEDINKRDGLLAILLNKHTPTQLEFDKVLVTLGITVSEYIRIKVLVYDYNSLFDEMKFLLPYFKRFYDISSRYYTGNLKVFESGAFSLEDVSWTLQVTMVQNNQDKIGTEGFQVYVLLNGKRSVFVRFTYSEGVWSWLLDKHEFVLIMRHRMLSMK